MDLSVVVIIVLQVLFVPSLLQTEDSYSSFILFAVLMISINVISIFKSLIDKDRSTLPVATPPSADSVGTCLLCASTVILVATLLTVKHFATKVETTNLAILFLVAGTGLLRIMKPNSYHGDYVLAVCYLLSILHTWKIAYFFFVDPVCKYESTTK